MEKFSRNYEKGDGSRAELEWGEPRRENESLERGRANRLREFIENNLSGTILEASTEKPEKLKEPDELTDLITAAEEHESRKRALQSGDSLNDGIPETKLAEKIINQLLSERDLREKNKKDAA